MEKIHKSIRVFMLSCIKHACFHVFSPFSAYFFPHDIIAEKGLFLSLIDTVGYTSRSEDLLLSAVRAMRALLLSLADRLVSAE